MGGRGEGDSIIGLLITTLGEMKISGYQLWGRSSFWTLCLLVPVIPQFLTEHENQLLMQSVISWNLSFQYSAVRIL